jgi:hypothetical protein
MTQKHEASLGNLMTFHKEYGLKKHEISNENLIMDYKSVKSTTEILQENCAAENI